MQNINTAALTSRKTSVLHGSQAARPTEWELTGQTRDEEERKSEREGEKERERERREWGAPKGNLLLARGTFSSPSAATAAAAAGFNNDWF